VLYNLCIEAKEARCQEEMEQGQQEKAQEQAGATVVVQNQSLRSKK